MKVLYGEGNWFHSRIGSSEIERDKVLYLVEISKTPSYYNLKWSGDKNNPLAKKFAKEISVKASTMQTKIRAFIRLGFIKEGSECPLELTPLARTWLKLRNQKESELNKCADDVEALMLTYSLALYSFNSEKYAKSPVGMYRPIYELLKHVNANGCISEVNLKSLIAGKKSENSPQNYTYWKRDLLRSKILIEDVEGFNLSNKFKFLMNEVRSKQMPRDLTDSDWERIHNDALDDSNPYKEAILCELDIILSDVLDTEMKLPEEDRNIVSEIVSITNYAEANEIGLGDYKIPDTYSKVKSRKKQGAWSLQVKRAYNFTCCVPKCDINSLLLVQAAHIKEYTATESEKGHRANPKNGLCLCPICHVLFDNGYFTLSNDLKIVVSTKIEEINSERIKDIFKQSNNTVIDPLPNPLSFTPDAEFIRYHKNNVFKI